MTMLIIVFIVGINIGFILGAAWASRNKSEIEDDFELKTSPKKIEKYLMEGKG